MFRYLALRADLLEVLRHLPHLVASGITKRAVAESARHIRWLACRERTTRSFINGQ